MVLPTSPDPSLRVFPSFTPRSQLRKACGCLLCAISDWCDLLWLSARAQRVALRWTADSGDEDVEGRRDEQGRPGTARTAAVACWDGSTGAGYGTRDETSWGVFGTSDEEERVVKHSSNGVERLN